MLFKSIAETYLSVCKMGLVNPEVRPSELIFCNISNENKYKQNLKDEIILPEIYDLRTINSL